MDNSMNLFENPVESPFFVGKVETTFFASQDNFYKVLLVKVEETSFDWHDDEVVVTGNFGEINEETAYRFEGKLVDHPKYGQQFQSNNYHSTQPTTVEGLVKFLSGDQFKGIGTKTAEKIVDVLGIEAIDKIVNDPASLNQLNLKPNIVKTLVDNLVASQGMDQIIIGLNDFGFGSSLATAIFEKYRDETLMRINKNPYQLARDIDGVSFKRADQVAVKLDVPADDTRRVDAGILQVIDDVTMQTGDTYTMAKPLLTQTVQLLEESRNVRINPKQVADRLVALASSNQIVAQDNRIYPTTLFNAEWKIAEHLHRLSSDESVIDDDKKIEATILKVMKSNQIEYDDSQKEAILQALKSRIFLLTGGPGTGKTTIIQGIVTAFAELHQYSLDVNAYKDTPFPILLAAPTGRAAKRMSETTGLPASTIHRLLGLNGHEESNDINVHDLNGSLLIVDELSMVDIMLFKTLLTAIPSTMQVILVGDKDQLPSVGPGQIFHDLLDFPQIPKVELSNIYRQSKESSIIPLAHAIKLGEVPDDLTKSFSDRSFIQCRTDQVPVVINQIVKKAQERDYSKMQVQILAPMYRGNAGINRLNTLAQDIFNPIKSDKTKSVEYRGENFRIGDKVLHLVNSPDNNVFNGDIGTIVSIELGVPQEKGPKTDRMVIEFDQNEVTYSRNEWQRLTLAYSISIHKSQGSQFEMVILPMVPQYSRMLQRNLLYTAITRSKSKLVLIGDPQSFAQAIKNEAVNRQTTLLMRLEDIFNGSVMQPMIVKPQEDIKKSKDLSSKKAEEGTTVSKDNILTVEAIMNGKIDPMIGMAGIRPKDFANV
ncbi:exonuclease V subunit alpha [Paucilactobacillus oligofermentans DSM 15707 = LMG 22743]|uniref:ATP-dependent RecD2 DNA helicase n=1 Tax=Paucilactobacillus oligofermentans DSM 15707 = LMG 22743 TaxID=1423778 RepID=A0A0R1RM53_9LACO|nr:ATP-dependent RecD-like DNA helicase [Paucilactobacillus oligofermentans]KRL54619.1 exonuclease V subunit alpha [Paucilactobacillus oligofermentans DSM 15707 = LMG 22743]